jgi:hypothetical protein
MNKYGLILPEIQDDNYVLGGLELPRFVLQPDGQWDLWLPSDEVQNRYVEPANCTAYGTFSAIETLLRRKYEYKDDYSERALGILAGTRPPGNDPHTVLETLRKKGAVEEGALPYTEDITTLEKYYSPYPLGMTQLIYRAALWVTRFEFGHEYVYLRGTPVPEQRKAIKLALQCSPVSVSVYAWAKDGEGIYYKPAGTQANHWCLIYGYREGAYWKVFDSYDNTHKKLDWDFDFEIAKRYHIEVKGPGTQSTSAALAILSKLWKELLDLLAIRTPAVAAPVAPEPVPPPLSPAPLPVSRLDDLCLAIRSMEGWRVGSRSWRNNNPGNLKCTFYTRSLGAVRADKDGFAVFLTPDAGMQALRQFLKDAAAGLLRAYKKNITLQEFFAVYAPSFENDPKGYSFFVAKELGVPVTTPLATLV